MFDPLEEEKDNEKDKEDPHRDIFGWLKDEPIIDLSHMELTNSVNGYVDPDKVLLPPEVISSSADQKPGATTGKRKMPQPSFPDSNSGFCFGSQLNAPTVMGQHNANMETLIRNKSDGMIIDSLWATASELEKGLYLNNAADTPIGSSTPSKTMKKNLVEKTAYQPMYACRPNMDNNCVNMDDNLYNFDWNWNWNDRSTFNHCVPDTQLAPARENSLCLEVKAEDQNTVTDVKTAVVPLGSNKMASNLRTVRKRRNMPRPRRFSGASSSSGLFETLTRGRETVETATPYSKAKISMNRTCAPNNVSSSAGPPSTKSLKLRGGIRTTGTHNPDGKEKEQIYINLKFLLQKELKNSDVGALARIVLPKKECEANLPPLTAREGLQICMEDMHLPRMWNFKFRYWPNNKSRMYLLENTGEFVKLHGLGCGDFIMLYKDEIKGNYIVRAKKVLNQLTPGNSVEKSGLYGSSTLLDDGSIHQSGSDKDNE
ncbi:hypothetical protein KI387_033530, partial [Taxus chinensis]